jgi:hypothetical protein
MTEKDVFEYNLDIEEKETILRLSIIDNNISIAIKDNIGNDNYKALMTLDELKGLCKAFNSTNTLREAIILLNNTIEAGNIFLTEDEQGTSIDLKFNITLASGKFPPFTVNLVKENPLNGNNTEIAPNQYAEQIEAKAKYGETKYSKPIVQENIKKPIVRTEYLKPIVQVKMPDGTLKTQTYEGKLPSGNEKTTESNYSYLTTLLLIIAIIYKIFIIILLINKINIMMILLANYCLSILLLLLLQINYFLWEKI